MFRAKGTRVSCSAILAFACTAQTAAIAIPQSPAKTPAEAAPQAASKAAELYQQALTLSSERKFDEARPLLERAVEAALQEKNPRVEALASYGLARYYYSRGEYARGLPYIERAVALYDPAADFAIAADAHRLNGNYLSNLGEAARALEQYRLALPLFEKAGNLAAKAGTLRDMGFIVPKEEAETLSRQALAIAREINHKPLEGILLRDLSDSLFSAGEYGRAIELLEQSAAILAAAQQEASLALTYTSMGRLLRAHGQPDRALEMYAKALALQEKVGDRVGTLQTYNAMGVSYSVLGRYREAGESYERALQLALDTGSEQFVDFLRGSLASNYVNLGEHARVAELLEEIIRRGKAAAMEFRYLVLADAYFALHRYADAMAANARASELYRTGGSDPALQVLLPAQRARYLSRAGRFTEALAEVREASRRMDELRARTSSSDFMRRGFADANQGIMQSFVAVLMEAGRPVEALEFAERARGRAFLDLLATREVALKPSLAAQVAEMRQAETSLPSAGAGSVARERESALPVTPRGAAEKSSTSGRLLDARKNANPELRSLVAAEPFSAVGLAEAAQRLGSTVLSYWVNLDAVHIWVVHPNGEVDVATGKISSQRLTQLVRAATAASLLGAARGESEALARPGEVVLQARAAGTLRLNNSSRNALRELYDILIQPVRDKLPRQSGSRLTIVPHGVLFWLPFAALPDARGRYLIEQYELHYTPAGAMLEFTKRKQLAKGSANVLIIADPARMPDAGVPEPLASLPGTRSEAAAIARLLTRSHTTVLSGTGASEAGVRAHLANSRVVHFATHGIVRDDEALESFLALGASSSAPAEDGRLTAQEIYGLDLQADLVFLSACRSGRGKISGDGIIGLTRGFIYAGTPAVVATLWDVADETTELLVLEFYRAYQRDGNRGRALRIAQLRMLRDLRAGRVKIPTAAGLFTLPEHPALWASFVLIGEP